jgi:hypothetical protein
MADLPKPTSTDKNDIIKVRKFTPPRIRDEHPAINQPGQDSVPGADSTD